MIFFFKQKTAYEMRISDWSSDVCSSDLTGLPISTEGSSRGSRVRPQARATAKTRNRTTGTRKAARHGLRERRFDSAVREVSLIIAPPAMVEEEVLHERSRA